MTSRFIWVDGDIDLQIVLDRSGSMGGAPIANARQAASLLVDTTADGQTGLGVGSFAGIISCKTRRCSRSSDPGDAVKAQIKSHHQQHQRGRLDAAVRWRAVRALASCATYQSSNSTTAPQVVFLLSDGDDTSSSSNESDGRVDVSGREHTAVHVWLWRLRRRPARLLSMANATGGQYTFSPTDLGQDYPGVLTGQRRGQRLEKHRGCGAVDGTGRSGRASPCPSTSGLGVVEHRAEFFRWREAICSLRPELTRPATP